MSTRIERGLLAAADVLKDQAEENIRKLQGTHNDNYIAARLAAAEILKAHRLAIIEFLKEITK